jgi:ketosteroid isomerase-like protein
VVQEVAPTPPGGYWRAMSQENVELVRRGFETWRRTRELDFDLLPPHVVWVLHGTPAGDVTYRGRDAVRGWFAEQDEAWSDQWWEVQDVRETRDGCVLALIVAHGVGRGSDVRVTLPLANSWTTDDGRVTHFEMFIDRRAALEAAGLSE